MKTLISLLFLLSPLVAQAASDTLYLPNLGYPASGTTSGGKHSLDVNITGASGALPIVVSSATVVETRIHDASSVNINGSGGAFVAFGSGAAIANTPTQVSVSATIGQPFTVRVGANAGAAAAAPDLFVGNQGEGPSTFGVVLIAGDKLWVRSLSVTAVTSGYITLNLAE